MRMLIRLAYRNIWRNKRRTLITAASILFAVFFAVVMRSIQIGAWEKMIDSVVHFYYGYVQIQGADYWDEQSVDNSILYDDSLRHRLTDIRGVQGIVPRLESFALASSEDQSRGVLLIGVDPVLEDHFTGLSERVTAGSYFDGGQGVMLGKGLAEYLGASVGDTAVFISMGYHGTNAAGIYPVTGIVSFPTPEFDKQLAFLTIDEAQWFYGSEGRVTSLVVDVTDPDDAGAISKRIRHQLDERYAVKDYQELVPDIIEAKAFDEAGGVVIMLILYMIIGFGIFGTMLMMLKEREFEFGILKAIGLKNRQLQIMVWCESIILALIGCIAGMIVSVPLVYYLQENPITFTGDMAEAYEKFGVEAVMPATLDPAIFFEQAAIVVVMITIMTLYPMIKVRSLEPVKAMRP